MKALIRISNWTGSDFLVTLIRALENLGYDLVQEEDMPDLVIADDPSLFLGREGNVVKVFVHQNPTAQQEIAKGIFCLTKDETLAKFTGECVVAA